MKARVLYAHLADNVFPSEGGKLNVIGIFAGIDNPGNISMMQFPAMFPRVALAAGISTTETKLPIEVTFRDGDGGDIVQPFSGTFEIERQKSVESASINFNLNFDNLRFAKATTAFITIESGGEELAELTLNVAQATPPDQAPPPAKP